MTKLFIYMCMGTLQTGGSETAYNKTGSETERENEVYMTFQARGEVTHLGASENNCRQSICSVIITAVYLIDRLKVMSGLNSYHGADS